MALSEQRVEFEVVDVRRLLIPDIDSELEMGFPITVEDSFVC